MKLNREEAGARLDFFFDTNLSPLNCDVSNGCDEEMLTMARKIFRVSVLFGMAMADDGWEFTLNFVWCFSVIYWWTLFSLCSDEIMCRMRLNIFLQNFSLFAPPHMRCVLNFLSCLHRTIVAGRRSTVLAHAVEMMMFFHSMRRVTSSTSARAWAKPSVNR